jgi:hypothetical protein
MFISNKEKSDINENIIRNKDQIDNVIKHVAKLQVDMGNSGLSKIAEMRDTVGQVQKMCWGAKDEAKKLQQQITMLREINDLLIKRMTEIELLTRARSQITIPKEKVQALKDAGIWQDPEKKFQSIRDFVEEKRKAEEKKERQRAYGRKYYANKKAKKAEQKQQELL